MKICLFICEYYLKAGCMETVFLKQRREKDEKTPECAQEEEGKSSQNPIY